MQLDRWTRRALSTIVIALALAAIAPFSPSSARGDAGRIVVSVEGLRTDRGQVLGALFHSREGWTEEGREIATCRAGIQARRATCVIDGVAPGPYAFAFLHDEDGDEELDRGFLGIPQEGFGFSNDAAPGLGPPSFESARFAHHGGTTEIRIRARYGI